MRIFALAFALWVASPAVGASIVIDFEEEPIATYDDELGATFVSAECDCVALFDQGGNRLTIRSFMGSHVLIIGDEGGSLRLDFFTPVTSVSLDFGGDCGDASVGVDCHAGAIDIHPAWLRGLADGQIVASSELAPNQDIQVNQTISITSATPMDQVRFGMPQYDPHEPSGSRRCPSPAPLGSWRSGWEPVSAGSGLEGALPRCRPHGRPPADRAFQLDCSGTSPPSPRESVNVYPVTRAARGPAAGAGRAWDPRRSQHLRRSCRTRFRR
jgi:hypothetical protein